MPLLNLLISFFVFFSVLSYPIPNLRGNTIAPILGLIIMLFFASFIKLSFGLIKTEPPKKFLLLIILGYTLSLLIPIQTDWDNITAIITRWAFALIIVLFVLFFNNKKNLNKIVAVTVFACVLIACYGFWGYVFGNVGYDQTEIWQNYSRYFGIHYTESTRNSDIYFLAFPFFVCLPFLQKANKKWHKSTSFVVCALCFLGLILSFSRGATISLFLVLFLFLLDSKVKTKEFIFWGGVFFLFGFFALEYFNMTTYFYAKLLSIVSPSKASFYLLESMSNETRIYLAKTTIEIWVDNPVWGVGIGNLPYYYRDAGFVLNHAENTYLSILAENGIIGLTGFSLITFSPLWLLAIEKNRKVENYLARGFFYCNLFIILTFLFNTETGNFFVWLIFAETWAFIFCQRQISISKKVTTYPQPPDYPNGFNKPGVYV